MFTINNLDIADKLLINDILSKINKKNVFDKLLKDKDVLLDTAEDDFKIHICCGSETTNDFDNGLKAFVAIDIFGTMNNHNIQCKLIRNELEIENKDLTNETIRQAFDGCLKTLEECSSTKKLPYKGYPRCNKITDIVNLCLESCCILFFIIFL